VVERLLPKQDIVGSSPITRSDAEMTHLGVVRFARLLLC
jgi:hypothetical protein